jgi:hypothetical protein
MEDLHAEHSVKTAGKTPGRYKGSPGVETFVVGQKEGQQASGGKAQAADEDLEKYTKEELLELLRKTKISPQGRGSQPRANRAGVGSDDADGASSISGSSSSSSESSSDSSSSSSAGDKSATPPSAQGE